jgi:transglutaminase-like putative cysteine protease
MTLDFTFQITSRLLALIGLLSLVLTHEFSFLFGLTAVAAVAASFILVLRGMTFNLSRQIWTSVNLTVLAFFIIDLTVFSQSLLTASTHFVVFLMINKLFNLRTPQDHIQLYLISFLQLLAASTYTIDVSFLISFVLYLLTATWALLLHHLTTEKTKSPGPSPPGWSTGLNWPFFMSTNTIAIAALGFSLLLFIFIPRVGLGFFHRPHTSLIRMSGFSNEVDLGEIGSVKRDPTVIMRVQTSRLLPEVEGIYWRGMVYDFYDGRTWQNRFGSGRTVLSEGNGVFNLAYRQHPERALTQEIILEPLDTVVLFGVPIAIQVSGQFSDLRVNAMNSISLPIVPATRIDYTLTSMLPELTQSDSETPTIPSPSPQLRPYLQMPSGSDRIGQLARDILLAATPADTVLQKITAIEKYLKTNYRYTLDVKPTATGMPIEDFLFRQKAGFCEHYATAMTLLLRSIGIPARLVTGFLPGEWNEFGRFYTVRQSNAHAWVEVWFERSGWIPFDPTPPAPPDYSNSFLGFAGRAMDSVEWWWNRYVIYFSLHDQISLANEVKQDTMKVRIEFMTWVSGLFNAAWALLSSALLHPILIMLAVLCGGAALFWGMRHLDLSQGGITLPWRKRLRRIQPHAFYYQMLDLLRAKGYPKPPTLTPQEFLPRIPDAPLPLRPAAAELTGLYYRVRFAGDALSDQEQSRIAELLQTFKSKPTETG